MVKNWRCFHKFLNHFPSFTGSFLRRRRACIYCSCVCVMPADVRKNKTTQSWCITGFAASSLQTMEPLEFSKTGKKRCLERQIFYFCGMTVVSSMVFEREISCQHLDVKMRMCCHFFLWRNLALFPGGVNQFLIGTFTPVSSLCMILYYYRPMDGPSD